MLQRGGGEEWAAGEHDPPPPALRTTKARARAQTCVQGTDAGRGEAGGGGGEAGSLGRNPPMRRWCGVVLLSWRKEQMGREIARARALGQDAVVIGRGERGRAIER
jgi:hypothetical protein